MESINLKKNEAELLAFLVEINALVFNNAHSIGEANGKIIPTVNEAHTVYLFGDHSAVLLDGETNSVTAHDCLSDINLLDN